MKEVGKLLRKARTEKGISMRTLAERTGVSASYISQIENNRRENPKPYVLKSLCEALGMNYYDLLVKTNKLTKEEARSQILYENSLQTSHVMEKDVPLTKKREDLHYLLTEYPGDLYYKHKKLNHKEQEKIHAIIQTIID